MKIHETFMTSWLHPAHDIPVHHDLIPQFDKSNKQTLTCVSWLLVEHLNLFVFDGCGASGVLLFGRPQSDDESSGLPTSHQWDGTIRAPWPMLGDRWALESGVNGVMNIDWALKDRINICIPLIIRLDILYYYIILCKSMNVKW
jgi:hypothetical protein